MQPPPPGMMMSAEASRRQTMGTLTTLVLIAGLFLIALAGMVSAYGNLGVNATTPPTQDQVNMKTVWAPIVWNLGMFALVFGIWGTALIRQNMDPMARLLLYLVSFIVILLIFTAPSVLFSGPP